MSTACGDGLARPQWSVSSRPTRLSLKGGTAANSREECEPPTPLSCVPSSAFIKMEDTILNLGTRFAIPGVESSSPSTVLAAACHSPDQTSHPSTSPEGLSPELPEVTWDDSDSESDVDSDANFDSNAQYVTIYPGSRWYKSVPAALEGESSYSAQRSYNISPSLSAFPSGSFLVFSPPPQEAGERLYCEGFSRRILADPLAEFDDSCLKTMEVPLLVAPHKAYEKLCKDSLSSDDAYLSRQPPDVPIDMAEGDEW